MKAERTQFTPTPAKGWETCQPSVQRAFPFASFSEAAQFGTFVERAVGGSDSWKLELAITDNTLQVKIVVAAGDTAADGLIKLTDSIDAVYAFLGGAGAS